MRKLLTMISILAMLMNTARVGDWRSAFSGADAALAGRPGYLRPLAMDERNGAEAAENSGRFAQLFFGARSTAKKLLSGLKTSDKASKGADMPRAEVAEEFRGKRHGDFVDWNSLRSPNRDRALRIRNLLLSKGIDNVMFCGGASRSVILDRKMGKDVDVMLTIESNERMETEVEWRALYSIYVSTLDEKKVDAVRQWSKEELENGDGRLPGLKKLRSIKERIDDAGKFFRWMPAKDLEPYIAVMIRDAGYIFKEDDLLRDIKVLNPAAMNELYKRQKLRQRARIYWEIAFPSIENIERALGFEVGSIAKGTAYIDGKFPFEIVGVADQNGRMCPKADMFLSYEHGLPLRVNSTGIGLDGRIFDPHDGIADMEEGILRFVSESGAVKYMNHQNVLRAVRFHFQLGFDYTSATNRLINGFFKGLRGSLFSGWLENINRAEEFLSAYRNLEDIYTGVMAMPIEEIGRRNKARLRRAKLRFFKAYLPWSHSAPVEFELMGYDIGNANEVLKSMPSEVRGSTKRRRKAYTKAVQSLIAKYPLQPMKNTLTEIWHKYPRKSGEAYVSPERREMEIIYLFFTNMPRFYDAFSTAVDINFERSNAAYKHDITYLGQQIREVYLGAIKNGIEDLSLVTEALRNTGVDRLSKIANIDLTEVEQKARRYRAKLLMDGEHRASIGIMQQI